MREHRAADAPIAILEHLGRFDTVCRVYKRNEVSPMESDNVSTDDDGQRYPGARSRYHPTELKKPGSKQWKVYERFNSDVLLLSLGTAAIQSGSDSF